MNVFRPIVHRTAARVPSQTFCRHASLDTVIWQGIRRDSREEARAFDRPRPRRSNDDDDNDDDAAARRIRQVGPYKARSGGPRVRRHIAKVDESSDWIYGTNMVLAALKGRRRTLHRLHIYAGANRTPDSRERDLAMKNLARSLKVDIREVTDLGMLDSVPLSPASFPSIPSSPLLSPPLPSAPLLSSPLLPPLLSSPLPSSPLPSSPLHAALHSPLSFPPLPSPPAPHKHSQGTARR